MRHPLTARCSQFTQLLNYMLTHTVTLLLTPLLLSIPSTSEKTIELEETQTLEVDGGEKKKRVRYCI